MTAKTIFNSNENLLNDVKKYEITSKMVDTTILMTD